MTKLPGKVLAVSALSVAVAVGIYVAAEARAGGTDRTGDAQVPGQLLSISIGEFVGGTSGRIMCQYDADVVVRDGKVATVAAVGEGTTVAVGQTVLGVMPASDPDRPAPSDEGETLNVYFDKTGELRPGCYPESIVVLDDGRELTLEEFDAEMEAKYGTSP